MVYTKNYNWKGKWKTMELTAEEVIETAETHQALSKEMMKECLQDADKIWEELKNTRMWVHINLERIAVALFDKRCPTLLTMIQKALDSKIKEITEKEEKKTQELRDEKLRDEKIKGDAHADK